MNHNQSSDALPDRRRFVTGGALVGMAGLAALACPSEVAAQAGTGAWYDVTNPIYGGGAKGDGTTNDAPAIQAAIDAMDTAGKGGVLYFPSSKRYRLGDATHTPTEIHLRADNMTVLMWGAELFATSATDNGDLMAVVDRRAPKKRIVQNVSVYGGLFTPGVSSDNGIGVAQGRHVLFYGCRVNNANGKNAFVIQTDIVSSGLAGNPPHISFVRLIGCESYGGGLSGLEVRSADADALIENVIVDGMHIEGINSSNTAIVCAVDSALRYIYRLTLANISISGTEDPLVYANTGIFLSGIERGIIDNVSMEVSNRGIETHNVSNCVMNNLVLMGQFGNAGLVCVEGAAEHPLSVTNFNINAFTYGIYVASSDVTAGPGTIRNCTTGIYTNAAGLRAVYQGIQFDACTTPVSAYQAGSKFFKLVNRVSGQAVLLHDDVT